MKRENRDITEEGQSAEDATFKFFIHKSDVLARILKDNIDELAGMSVEEIKGCLQLEADGKTVIGRETEYITRDGRKVVLDSVFDVCVPGTGFRIPILVGLEGQKNPRPGYPLGKRAEYYLARMVSEQKDKYFTGKNYGGLRKTYSIWCILEPRKGDLNSVVRYRMKAERTYGHIDNEPEELVTFNIIMINLGSYKDNLPDSLAIGTAMFSKMEDSERRELVKHRFNIELDDSELERLKEMSTLGQDKYDHGYADGEDNGIRIGTEEGIRIGTVSTAADAIIALMETGMTMEEAFSRFPLKDQYRDDVTTEVRRRLQSHTRSVSFWRG